MQQQELRYRQSAVHHVSITRNTARHCVYSECELQTFPATTANATASSIITSTKHKGRQTMSSVSMYICLRKFQLVPTGSAFLQGMTYVDRSTQPRVKSSVGKKRRTAQRHILGTKTNSGNPETVQCLNLSDLLSLRQRLGSDGGGFCLTFRHRGSSI